MLTFSLIVILMWPAGDTMLFEAGDNLTRAQCEAAIPRVQLQLEQTLTEAGVLLVACRPAVDI
jgi:hypothetical protein